jgi:23S rRNA (uracil-5-)-methyltransferase RumA
MKLSYSGQLAWKRQLVVDSLSRIGRLTAGVEPVRPSPSQFGYRNKMEFTLGRDASGRPCVGLHSEAGPVVDVASCPVQTKLANRVLASAREFLLDGRCTPAGVFEARPEPHRLVLRVGADGATCLVLLRVTGTRLAEDAALASHLVARHPEIVGVVRFRARPGQRGGGVTETLTGRNWLEEKVAGLTVRVPAGSFFQVNPSLIAELIDCVATACSPKAGVRALDIYGGIGLHGLALARGGAHVTICEADPTAVRAGRAAARANGIHNVTYVRADAREFLERTAREGLRPEIIVANPPRTGLGAQVVRALGRLRAQTLVLVSCDPATLARDLRGLIDVGHRVTHVMPFDLFPQTPHVETVCRLEAVL